MLSKVEQQQLKYKVLPLTPLQYALIKMQHKQDNWYEGAREGSGWGEESGVSQPNR